MSHRIEQLEPRALWGHFAALNAVPRGSKREQRAIEFMRDFGRGLGLETEVDGTGNVIIRKPATKGMEDRAGIVLQGHLDMVQQKNAGTDFDFDTQGIEMVVDDDWVRARGTTLGADNGIGVACAMAVLASDDLSHPAIEALFTVDEETGMTGAKGLEPGRLRGAILLNLDSEDDGEVTIGCAGGIDVSARGRYEPEPLEGDEPVYRLSVSGLSGGHSGMDIHLGRGNANQLLVRLLLGLDDAFGIQLTEIDSGGLRNAIPREGSARFVAPGHDAAALERWLGDQAAILKAEYAVTDPELSVALATDERAASRLPQATQRALLRAVAACPGGIHRMSPDVGGLVQTSNNLARFRVSEGAYEVSCLARGSVDSEKLNLAQRIAGLFSLLDAETELSGDYPGWKPEPSAPIISLVSDTHEELFGKPLPAVACHAGLECGIIGQAYPDLQMVSFGPNIRGAHSPDEKVQVSSVQKTWRLLTEVLARIPS